MNSAFLNSFLLLATKDLSAKVSFQANIPTSRMNRFITNLLVIPSELNTFLHTLLFNKAFYRISLLIRDFSVNTCYSPMMFMDLVKNWQYIFRKFYPKYCTLKCQCFRLTGSIFEALHKKSKHICILLYNNSFHFDGI